MVNTVDNALTVSVQCHRTFLKRAYPTMKKHNPHIPIMMREAMGTEPRVFARYGTDNQRPLTTDCQDRLKKEHGLTVDGNRIRKGDAGGIGG